MNQVAVDFDKLIHLLPETCLAYLSENNLDTKSLTDYFSVQKIWDAVLDTAKNTLSEQFSGVLQIFMLCLLCAVFGTLVSESAEKQISRVVSFVSTSVCLGTVIGPTCKLIEFACESLQQGCIFLGTFAPAYGAAAAAAGRPATATVYTTMSALAVQILSAFCSQNLKQVLVCFMCLAIAGCLCDEISLNGVLSSCKKMIMWLISGAIILFNGILSVQTFVTKPTDTLALKTGKVVVSSLLPVVGSAVSDAFTTIYGGMAAAQSAVGIYGIVSVCLLFLPVFFSCLFFRLSVWICDMICSFFQLPPAQKCMQGCALVIDILLALIGAFLCLFVISCMLLTGG